MAVTTVSITHSESTADMQRLLRSTDTSAPNDMAIATMNYFGALVSGNRAASVDVQVAGGASVAATGTITLSSHVATDTVTVNGVVFTCVASGATGNQYNVGGTDTLTAVALAAAITATATALAAPAMVVATSATNVVTLTAATKGVGGNAITIAISAHGSVSGARLTGGVAVTANSFNLL